MGLHEHRAPHRPVGLRPGAAQPQRPAPASTKLASTIEGIAWKNGDTEASPPAKLRLANSRWTTESMPRPPSAAETAAAVHDAVRRLPRAQREVVALASFGGLSYRDVARVLGVPEGTARSRVRLALATLGSLLDRRLLES
jgi:DNA-directed RNA polymerase specialized sigma24 family protein